MREKYWENKNKLADCGSQNEDKSKDATLGWSQLGGVFIIVGFFLLLSCFISFLEYSWWIKKNSKKKVIFLLIYDNNNNSIYILFRKISFCYSRLVLDIF